MKWIIKTIKIPKRLRGANIRDLVINGIMRFRKPAREDRYKTSVNLTEEEYSRVLLITKKYYKSVKSCLEDLVTQGTK